MIGTEGAGAGAAGEDASAPERVLVVGGGIAGSTVALSLVDRGAGVALVDRPTAGAATSASAGMLAAQWEVSEPDALFRLGRRGRELHPGFAERVEALSGEGPGLSRGGMLVANRDADEERAARDTARRQRREGLRARIVDPSDATELQPGLAPSAVSWLWLADEGWLDAQRLAAALPPALAGAGVELVDGTVERVRIDGAAATGVELRSGVTVAARRVVLACGAWTGRLNGLPRRVPVRPVRGQLLQYAGRNVELSRIVSGHGGRYVVPRPDGSVIAGSTMEDAGFEPRVTEAGRRSIRAAAKELVPALAEADVIDAWAGLRPVTPDGLPILGPDPEVEGLFYATGYGRNGILVAPAAAELVADLVTGRKPEIDWRPFALERFVTGGGI